MRQREGNGICLVFCVRYSVFGVLLQVCSVKDRSESATGCFTGETDSLMAVGFCYERESSLFVYKPS
jgi:hypothetical protein